MNIQKRWRQRLIDAHGEQRLARVVWSKWRVAVVQVAKEKKNKMWASKVNCWVMEESGLAWWVTFSSKSCGQLGTCMFLTWWTHENWHSWFEKGKPVEAVGCFGQCKTYCFDRIKNEKNKIKFQRSSVLSPHIPMLGNCKQEDVASFSLFISRLLQCCHWPLLF